MIVRAKMRHTRLYVYEGYQDVEIDVPAGTTLDEVEQMLRDKADKTSGDISMRMLGSTNEPDEIDIDEWIEDPIRTIQEQMRAAGP